MSAHVRTCNQRDANCKCRANCANPHRVSCEWGILRVSEVAQSDKMLHRSIQSKAAKLQPWKQQAVRICAKKAESRNVIK